MPVLAWCTSLMPALAWCTSLRTRTAEALPINFRHGRHESSQLQREAKRLQARRGTYRRRRPSLSWRAGFGANGDGPSPLAPIRGTPGPLSHSSVFYTDSSHKYQPRARRYGRRAPHPARRPPAMRSRAHLGERGGARGESRRERRRGPSSTGTPRGRPGSRGGAPLGMVYSRTRMPGIWNSRSSPQKRPGSWCRTGT